MNDFYNFSSSLSIPTYEEVPDLYGHFCKAVDEQIETAYDGSDDHPSRHEIILSGNTLSTCLTLLMDTKSIVEATDFAVSRILDSDE